MSVTAAVCSLSLALNKLKHAIVRSQASQSHLAWLHLIVIQVKNLGTLTATVKKKRNDRTNFTCKATNFCFSAVI